MQACRGEGENNLKLLKGSHTYVALGLREAKGFKLRGNVLWLSSPLLSLSCLHSAFQRLLFNPRTEITSEYSFDGLIPAFIKLNAFPPIERDNSGWQVLAPLQVREIIVRGPALREISHRKLDICERVESESQPDIQYVLW